MCTFMSNLTIAKVVSHVRSVNCVSSYETCVCLYCIGFISTEYWIIVVIIMTMLCVWTTKECIFSRGVAVQSLKMLLTVVLMSTKMSHYLALCWLMIDPFFGAVLWLIVRITAFVIFFSTSGCVHCHLFFGRKKWSYSWCNCHCWVLSTM